MEALGAAAGIITTLLIVAASLCVTLVSIAIPVGIMIWIFRKVAKGEAVMVTNLPVGVVGQGVKQESARRIKKITCRSCGASKQTPPKTAYLYCDYCGALTDWDFVLACESGAASAQPGPEYERLQARLAARKGEALANGDREAYKQIQLELFDAHMKACPASYSPRLGDPDYRAALLDYTASAYTAAAFDPECQRLEQAMQMAVGALQWTRGMGKPTRVEQTSFQRLIDAFKAHNDRFLQVCEPLLASHPDEPTLELQSAIGASAFLQGWMPYLDKPQQDALMEQFGLSGQYVDVVEVETEERHCGGCGAVLQVVPGARRVICESCGRANDVSLAEIACTSCGTPLSLPVGKTHFSCPSCQADLRMEGVAPGS